MKDDMSVASVKDIVVFIERGLYRLILQLELSQSAHFVGIAR